MLGWLSTLGAVLLLAAAPAPAAPCQTQGAVSAPIAFPRNDASDVPFARSMVPVILPDVAGALPAALTCTRSTVRTALGDYVLGGENADAFPRIAMRADGKGGPVAYVVSAPEVSGTFALVVHTQGGTTILKRFYAGIPTDERLADDIRAALADRRGIMAYEAKRQMVQYGFTPTGGFPPPVPSGPRTDGGSVVTGPQIMVLSSGDPQLLDMANGMRHTPSGFACRERFDGAAVLLKTIDPRSDYLSCGYRAGTDLRFREADPVRYQITLIKAPPGATAREIFDKLSASVHGGAHIKGDHLPPLSTGSAPAPEFAAAWDTEGASVQAVWVGKAGDWLAWVLAQYPRSNANDAEAGKIVGALFTQVGEQVR